MGILVRNEDAFVNKVVDRLVAGYFVEIVWKILSEEAVRLDAGEAQGIYEQFLAIGMLPEFAMGVDESDC